MLLEVETRALMVLPRVPLMTLQSRHDLRDGRGATRTGSFLKVSASRALKTGVSLPVVARR